MFKKLYVKVLKMMYNYHRERADKFWELICEDESNRDERDLWEDKARYHTRREDEIANEILELEGI